MDSVFYPEHQQVSRNMWTEGDRYSRYSYRLSEIYTFMDLARYIHSWT